VAPVDKTSYGGNMNPICFEDFAIIRYKEGEINGVNGY